MSTSCVFHLQVWPSSPTSRESLAKAFARFLDDDGLSSELAVESVELEGIAVLRATSEWAMAISGAGTWVPEAQARFEHQMRAIDPACDISFDVRYPDEEEDLIDELNTTWKGMDATRRIDAFFSYRGGEVSSGRSTISIPAINAGHLVLRFFSVGDFFGVVDSDGNTFQALLEKNGLCWIEVPMPKERGSYGKFVRRDQLAEIVKSLPERITPFVVDGLEFTRS